MYKIKKHIPLEERIKSFIGVCKSRVILEDDNEVSLGRCSSGAISRFSITKGVKVNYHLLEIGNFCEFSECDIIIGGTHDSERVFNGTLSGLSLIRSGLLEDGETKFISTHGRTTKISDAVILSKRCLINAGSDLGTGSLIGAGAVTVASKKIDRFSIAVGVPAVSIKSRLTSEKREIAEQLQWWNWDLDYLCLNTSKLIECEKNYKELLSTRVMAEDRYKLVIAMKGMGPQTNLSLLGIDDDGKFIPMRDTNTTFREYFSQIKKPETEELTWVADPFKLLVM